MKDIIRRIITALALGALFFALFFLFPPFVFSAALAAILLYILIFEWPHFFALDDFRFWLLMPLYPALPFILMILLNQNPEYRHLLVALIAIVAGVDSGGYVFGNLFGKHKIAPSISPGKTWEGFVGGCFTALVASIVLLLISDTSIQFFPLIISVVITSILSLIGDMFESWLKRRARIKDSGHILPGHGGFLDRFDGIMFGVVFFYVSRELLITIFG